MFLPQHVKLFRVFFVQQGEKSIHLRRDRFIGMVKRLNPNSIIYFWHVQNAELSRFLRLCYQIMRNEQNTRPQLDKLYCGRRIKHVKRGI